MKLFPAITSALLVVYIVTSSTYEVAGLSGGSSVIGQKLEMTLQRHLQTSNHSSSNVADTDPPTPMDAPKTPDTPKPTNAPTLTPANAPTPTPANAPTPTPANAPTPANVPTNAQDAPTPSPPVRRTVRPTMTTPSPVVSTPITPAPVPPPEAPVSTPTTDAVTDTTTPSEGTTPMPDATPETPKETAATPKASAATSTITSELSPSTDTTPSQVTPPSTPSAPESAASSNSGSSSSVDVSDNSSTHMSTGAVVGIVVGAIVVVAIIAAIIMCLISRRRDSEDDPLSPFELSVDKSYNPTPGAFNAQNSFNSRAMGITAGSGMASNTRTPSDNTVAAGIAYSQFYENSATSPTSVNRLKSNVSPAVQTGFGNNAATNGTNLWLSAMEPKDNESYLSAQESPRSSHNSSRNSYEMSSGQNIDMDQSSLISGHSNKESDGIPDHHDDFPDHHDDNDSARGSYEL